MKTLRTFLFLASPFWRSRQQWQAWLMLLSVIGMGLLIVQINVLINAWSKTFYDTLGEFKTEELYALMGQYALYLAAYVLIVVYMDWLRKALVLRWRRAMTESTIGQWLSGQAYYRLGLTGEPDNPDQRIADDIDILVNRSIELLVSFIANVAQVGAFMAILWNLSGVQTFSLFGHSVTVHGYLVWIAVVYTVLGTAITHAIGRPLLGLTYEQQRREADFRASLLRKREHAEQIALYRGEGVEQRQLGERFTAIAQNWWRLMSTQRNLGFFTVSYDRVSLIIPVFAALPAFLAKTITLGGLMQIRSAFSAVQGSLSWFIDSYRRLMEWSATVQRLGQFQQAIEASRSQLREPRQAPHLSIHNLQVNKPDGGALFAGLTATVASGEWVRIDGASGLGKSSLLRTLQGIWPYYQGDWQVPVGRSLLLPQQPYLPTVTLRQLLAYPDHQLPDDSRLLTVLEQVGLTHLREQLEREAEWNRELSGGEQQRVAVARALLYQPDTLYLDETTSQLDERSALQLMALLKAELPSTTVIGISHQPSVALCFGRSLRLPGSAAGEIETASETVLA